MAKRKTKTAAPKRKERPRAEIDRNYFFGDVLRKTSGALFIALGLIAAYAPFRLIGMINSHMNGYLAVMGTFGVIGAACYLYGRHLRREATHWEFE